MAVIIGDSSCGLYDYHNSTWLSPTTWIMRIRASYACKLNVQSATCNAMTRVMTENRTGHSDKGNTRAQLWRGNFSCHIRYCYYIAPMSTLQETLLLLQLLKLLQIPWRIRPQVSLIVIGIKKSLVVPPLSPLMWARWVCNISHYVCDMQELTTTFEWW